MLLILIKSKTQNKKQKYEKGLKIFNYTYLQYAMHMKQRNQIFRSTPHPDHKLTRKMSDCSNSHCNHIYLWY